MVKFCKWNVIRFILWCYILHLQIKICWRFVILSRSYININHETSWLWPQFKERISRNVLKKFKYITQSALTNIKMSHIKSFDMMIFRSKVITPLSRNIILVLVRPWNNLRLIFACRHIHLKKKNSSNYILF